MTILRAVAARQDDIRAFQAREPVRECPVPDRVAELETEVAALKESLVALRATQDRKLAEEREAGRREGEGEARHDFAARTELLAQSTGEAVVAVDARLAAHEGLAVLIAEAALARLFDTPSAGRDLVVAAIRRQVAGLRRDTVLGVHVSAADFPDEADLQRAGGACGGYRLVASPDLPPGGCLIKLTLGEIDLGLPTQWATLSGLLRQFAVEGAAA